MINGYMDSKKKIINGELKRSKELLYFLVLKRVM